MALINDTIRSATVQATIHTDLGVIKKEYY